MEGKEWLPSGSFRENARYLLQVSCFCFSKKKIDGADFGKHRLNGT